MLKCSKCWEKTRGSCWACAKRKRSIQVQFSSIQRPVDINITWSLFIYLFKEVFETKVKAHACWCLVDEEINKKHDDHIFRIIDNKILLCLKIGKARDEMKLDVCKYLIWWKCRNRNMYWICLLWGIIVQFLFMLIPTRSLYFFR